jgi:hypothetical protein
MAVKLAVRFSIAGRRSALSTGSRSPIIWYSQSGTDLIISIIGTNDSVTVQGWYKGSNQKLDRVQLTEGSYALASDVEARS